MRGTDDYMRRLRWCLLAITPLVLLSIGRAQEKHPPFSVDINSFQHFKVGSTVPLVIHVKNISSSPIDLGLTKAFAFDFLFSVRDSEGEEPAQTPYYQAVQGKEEHKNPHLTVIPRWSSLPTSLSPGETLTLYADLARLFDFKPGKYTVQLSRPDRHGSVWLQLPNDHGLVIASNTIWITMTP